MKIKFETHADYALACKILSSLVGDKAKLGEMTDLFYEASNELKGILIKDIYFPKNEIKNMEKNNKILWSHLEVLPNSKGSKLEDLVHSFTDIGFLAQSGTLQTTKQ